MIYRIFLLFWFGLSSVFVHAQVAPVKTKKSTSKIIVAGGCFWCMEQPFDILPGVKSTTSGYIGGSVKNPTYKQVTSGSTGHTEAVQIVFDPAQVKLEKILEVFWRSMDPTDKAGQFADRGSQYRPGIFYFSEAQKKIIEKSKAQLVAKKVFSKPIVVEVTKAGVFYKAEAYHQNYYKTNSKRYKFYRYHSGRDEFLQKHWGKKK